MGNHRSKRIRLSRKMRAGSAAAVTVAVLVGAAITPDPALGRDDSLLRAVDVAMSSDGTLTAVKATSITTRASQSASSSTEDDYSPNEVVNDLPVRIVTSYRTENTAGTDLSELDGYSGKVVIDVSVENLTLDSQQVSYDMGGNGYTTSALVGAPMTVTASASLGDTPASTVVVEGAQDTTNGLVSLNADGNTQVQWGSLVAPPMLPAAADLRLVVDAKNFSAPDFNISVQPGLAMDSSSSALLDASTQAGAQIDLEERTITAAAQVSGMLAQASQTIQDVRSSLDTSAGTIGTRTLSDMQASTKSLENTMSAVGGQLDDLKSSLQSVSTQSSSQTLTQLSSSVEAMSTMLGDTSGSSSDGQSVYATVQNVANQLQAYADASEDQREGLNQALDAAIGPAEPNKENCPTSSASGGADEPASARTPTGKAATDEAADTPTGAEAGSGQQGDQTGDDGDGEAIGAQAPDSAARTGSSGTSSTDTTQQLSATCALYQGQQSFESVLNTFNSQVKGLLDGATSTATEQATGVADTAASVDAQAQTVLDDITALQATEAGRADALSGLGAAIGDLGSKKTALENAIKNAKTMAETGRKYNDTDVTNQVQAAIDKVCAADPADPEGLLPLLSTKDCNGKDLPGDAQKTSVQALLKAESGKWQALSDSLDTTRTTDPTGLGATLSAYDTAYTALQSRYAELTRSVGGAGAAENPEGDEKAPRGNEADTGNEVATGDDAGSLSGLAGEARKLKKTTASLKSGADGLSASVGELDDNVNTALSAAEVDARTAMQEAISGDNGAIRRVNDAASASRSASQGAFDQSALSESAQQMTDQAKSSIDAQNQALAESYTQTQQSMESSTLEAQQAVAVSIDQSAVDLTGANALLSDDMAKLLADIGDPSVAGSGLLGSLGTNAALAQTADAQLAVASGAMTGYANVRSTDLGGLLLRQAQMSASMERLDQLPLFRMRKPSGGTTNSVYVFSIEGSR